MAGDHGVDRINDILSRRNETQNEKQANTVSASGGQRPVAVVRRQQAESTIGEVPETAGLPFTPRDRVASSRGGRAI